ncbi:hypothetical protein MRX96_011640 [Rhipicephalus microplus]
MSEPGSAEKAKPSEQKCSKKKQRTGNPRSASVRKVVIRELEGCRLHGLTISRAIDHSVDTCADFYKYTLILVMERGGKPVTASQTFYQRCINAAKEKEKNGKAFLDFKRDQGGNINFLFDVGAIYSNGGPALLISRSQLHISYKARIDEPWRTSAEELRRVEDKTLGVKRISLLDDANQDWFPVSNLGSRTPSVPSGMWMDMLVKHDHQFNWTPNCTVIVDDDRILAALEELLKTGSLGLHFLANDEDLKKQACVYCVNGRLGALSTLKILKERFGTILATLEAS